MLWQVIGDILPLAVGAGICVMPIIAVVVLLTTEGGAVKAYSLVIGWLVGAVSFTALLALLGNGADVSDEPGQPSTLGSVIQIVLGAVLLYLSVTQFRHRPKGDGEIETPKWLGKLDSLSPLVAFAGGAVLSFGNVKNIVLLPSAAVTISRGDLRTSEVLFASLVFGVIASLGIAAPLVLSLVAGDRAGPMMASLRVWLTRYSAVIIAVLFLILGWNMLGKGIGGLFG